MTSRDSAIDLRNRAFALREDQDMEAAFAAIAEAVRHLPDDPQARFAHAQIAFETGRPAAALFDEARALNGTNPEFIRNRAAAHASEGRVDSSVAELESILASQPDWLDGHRLLANLRVTHGDPDPARSYAKAVQAAPANLSLRLAWLHMLSTARQWEAARRVLDEGGRLLGERSAFLLARAFIDSESGEAADDPHLFDALVDIRDPGFDLCQTRHWLRLGDPAKAEAIAARNIGTPAETVFWPYLSLAWRLLSDDRAAWLDRHGQFIRSYDLDFTAGELRALTTTLNRLHTLSAPYLEQSVRGGTQTEGNLFLRHEPPIQLARAKCLEAVGNYIDSLPAPEPDHPLLGNLPDRLHFEGSWSVRLAAHGFHSVHTHTRGWISSALYVDLPAQEAMGAPPQGWIEFGAPPPELNLDLAPYTNVEPSPARLVLFPSTMWHRTVPFESGDRLTIAFDIRRNAR